jgi:hypothetical protein
MPVFVVRGPMIIAFFPGANENELEADPNGNETLQDFELYVSRAVQPLQKAGVDFHSVYAASFRLHIRSRVITFRARKAQPGYYFIVPGKRARIEYGVETDADILQLARQYFSMAVK